MKRKVIFAVNVNEVPRQLFSVKEDEKGELIVGFKSANRMQGLEPFSQKIKSQKISVHPTTDSVRYNQIKENTTVANGDKIEFHILTDAIKLKRGFTPIFVRLTPDLSSADYGISREKYDLVKIGTYDPSRSSLVVSLGIAHPDAGIDTTLLANGSSLSECTFGMCKLLLLSATIPLPSLGVGFKLNYATSSPEHFDDAYVSPLSATMRRLAGEEVRPTRSDVDAGLVKAMPWEEWIGMFPAHLHTLGNMHSSRWLRLLNANVVPNAHSILDLIEEYNRGLARELEMPLAGFDED